jgi:TolB protein
MFKYLSVLVSAIFVLSCNQNQSGKTAESKADTLKISGEKHLKNIKMLTFEGENAEAYFSFNEDQLIYQSTHGKYPCDQIFTMDLNGKHKKLVSTGKGRTTCSYFLPGDKRIIYASTHGADSACPPKPDFSQGYVWKVYKEFDLYKANADGRNPQVFLPAPGYDAEATVSPKGDKLVFTSMRNGDLDIYTVNIDGTDLKQLTHALGYDGGPFFSWDGAKIVYRSYHPKSDKAIERYKNLLSQDLIQPSTFQLMVMDADGSNKKQITDNEYANFAPFFHPDNKRIIFCSNMNSNKQGQPIFNLWMINEDGSALEQITFFDGFDGFPMFTHDGKKLVFASNRFNRKPHDTNVFIADWVE